MVIYEVGVAQGTWRGRLPGDESGSADGGAVHDSPSQELGGGADHNSPSQELDISAEGGGSVEPRTGSVEKEHHRVGIDERSMVRPA